MSIHSAKRKFFNRKIYEITSSNKRSWDLMSWVKKKSLPAIKTISYEDQLCNTLLELWCALYGSYNSAEDRPIDTRFLNKLPQANIIE